MNSVSIVVQAQPHIALDWRSSVAFALVFVASAFVTRSKPAAGIAIMLALDPFSLSRYVGDTTITLPKVALLAVATGLLVRNPHLEILLEHRLLPLIAAAATVVAATALTIVASAHHAETLRETLKDTEYFAAFIVAVVAFALDPDERAVYRGLLAGGIAAIVVALVQDYTIAPAAIDVRGARFPRIAGPLDGPNQFAGYLEILLPVLLAFRLMRGAHAILDLTFVAGLFACVLTFSRGGLSGLLLGCAAVVVAVVRPHAMRAFVIATAAAACVFAAAFGAAVMSGHAETARAGPDNFSGLGTRTDLWRAAWAMWRAHPWLGVGAGNFELEIAAYGPSGVRTHANSLYLQSLAEGGAVLFAATVALFATAWATLLRNLRTPLVVGALGATLALAAHQVVDDLFFFPKVGELWWIVLGIAAATIVRSSAPLRRV
jgi:O-antigen ligase